jgi:hypothetical protein
MDNRLTVERLLKRQLALAYPTPVTIDDQRYAMFRGSTSRIEFVSDYSLADGPSDFRRIDYAFEDGQFLYGEKSMYGYIPAEMEDLTAETLVSFDQVAFKYLGKDDRDQPVWIDEWKMTTDLPLAVQVQIEDDIFIIRLVNREQ